MAAARYSTSEAAQPPTLSQLFSTAPRVVEVWTTVNVLYCVGCMWLCLVRTRRKTVAMMVEVDELYKQLVRHSGVRPSVRPMAISESMNSFGSGGGGAGDYDQQQRAPTLAYLRKMIAFVVRHTSKRSDPAVAAREDPQDIEDGFMTRLDPGNRSPGRAPHRALSGGEPGTGLGFDSVISLKGLGGAMGLGAKAAQVIPEDEASC
jgi:hypothetical protein